MLALMIILTCFRVVIEAAIDINSRPRRVSSSDNPGSKIQGILICPHHKIVWYMEMNKNSFFFSETVAPIHNTEKQVDPELGSVEVVISPLEKSKTGSLTSQKSSKFIESEYKSDPAIKKKKTEDAELQVLFESPLNGVYVEDTDLEE